MKPRVAVICASNPGNAGMYSVDMAAVDFMVRHNINFKLFSSHAPARFGRYRFLHLGLDIGHRSNERFGALSFRRLENISQLNKYSHVLYWGDFTPNPVYGYGDFHEVDKRYDVGSTRRESIDKWARLYNLSEGRINSKVIAVGNNFQHDYLKDFHIYEEFLENLESNFDLVMPRDPFSVQNLQSFLGVNGKQKVRDGLDPAFLLSDKFKNIEKASSNTFCYFFGRSELSDALKYAADLEREIGLKGVCFSKWLSLNSKTADSVFMNYLFEIKKSRFLITDLYHLAINGIRMGIPVFCLGNPAQGQEGTIGDFKKKVLFKMLGLQNYYIEVEPNNSSELGRVIQFIEKALPFYEKNITEVYAKKRSIIEKFESELLCQIL